MPNAKSYPCLWLLANLSKESDKLIHLLLVHKQIDSSSLFDRPQEFTLDELLDVKRYRGLSQESQLLGLSDSKTTPLDDPPENP